jgi:hypothetical protein
MFRTAANDRYPLCGMSAGSRRPDRPTSLAVLLFHPQNFLFVPGPTSLLRQRPASTKFPREASEDRLDILVRLMLALSFVPFPFPTLLRRHRFCLSLFTVASILGGSQPWPASFSYTNCTSLALTCLVSVPVRRLALPAAVLTILSDCFLAYLMSQSICLA